MSRDKGNSVEVVNLERENENQSLPYLPVSPRSVASTNTTAFRSYQSVDGRCLDLECQAVIIDDHMNAKVGDQSSLVGDLDRYGGQLYARQAFLPDDQLPCHQFQVALGRLTGFGLLKTAVKTFGLDCGPKLAK